MSLVDAWSITASVATTLGIVVVIIAALIAVRQLNESQRARHLEGMMRAYELISSEAARDDRRYVYRELAASPSEMSAEDRRRADRVCVNLDTIATLIAEGLMPARPLFIGHASAIWRIWVRLEPYVRARREEADDETHVRAFENLAIEARDFLSSQEPQHGARSSWWRRPLRRKTTAHRSAAG